MKADSTESPVTIEPLGLALKEARTVASLSIEDVAHKLNLGVTTVRDLEDNLALVLEENKYPAIYLRGYLANYAKLVELADLTSFSEYQQLESERKTKKTLPKSKLIIPPPSKKTSKLLPLTLLLVIAVGLVVYLSQTPFFTSLSKLSFLSDSMPALAEEKKLMLNNKKNDKIISKALVIENMPEQETIAVEPSDIPVDSTPNNDAVETKQEVIIEPEPIAEVTPDISESESIVTISEPIVASSVIAESPVEPAQTVTETIAPTDEPSVVIAQVAAPQETMSVIEQPLAENIIEAEVVPELVEADAPIASVSDIDETVEAQTSLIQPEILMLAFNAECWTEVFDATGKRIAFGLYKSGRVLTLNGIAPFKLKLGDPSVVEIQYQDQVINGEFTPGRSAQFSVPLS